MVASHSGNARKPARSFPRTVHPTPSFPEVSLDYDDVSPKKNAWQRLLDSFKRNPHAQVSKLGQIDTNGKLFDLEEAVANIALSPLKRKLKGRHLQMIAIGGSVGTGLFVSSGRSLAIGGPASLVIAFSLVGIMVYSTIHALGEMAVLFPVAGSFSSFSTRFLDPAWGFAMGWNYALQWLVVLPLEIVAASLTVSYWPSHISPAAWVAIFYTMVITINLFGVQGYGEAEFIFSIIKVVAIVGFIILGIVINIGGGDNGSYIGFRYWRDPGAFNHGFKGLCSCFVNAAFAFTGTELVGLAAAEASNPVKALPSAVRQVFWRITLFYIVALIIVGLLVPYTEARLLNPVSQADTKASPFVIAIRDAGIQGLDSVMNVVIMLAVLSVGNSAIYGSSRTLAALAEQHQAPRFLAYIDRRGRPLFAIIVASAIGLLSFLAASSKQEEVFIWMMAISGLSSILNWASICLAHIRFRRGWALQGHSLDELAFTSQPGVVGSWIGFIFNILVLMGQFWVGVAPIIQEMDGDPTVAGVKNWFSVYLAAPIVILFYVPYKIRFKTKIVRAKDMDLKTGRRDLHLAHLIAEERAERAEWPLWKKVYRFFC
ncbi:general amino-acid permease GAP1, putative [Coccidioides posadasii C735 delta SOWgp]|uniref:General amino-acid permease GAP1, putative n=1 Tax=Coccidioides posadasii (strain C735) TaxID=222929 RepID=C5PBH3_COCP7|nr:general amino-acid permease GAP1, putative [Coccidioides posadasii C735 delta SOWgp]EER25957.1 general amino-acid permease GAP1, putative [Coccidioides posadasii C735 delta SOWgp]|eukprot:XP_003068102.1 general amino-acid permease GAP1, putative [Coccidioides posadasii C735 delta SOWgp]